MNTYNAELQTLIDEASTIITFTRDDGFAWNEPKSYAVGTINGHTVELTLVNSFRRNTSGKETAYGKRWKVDGKVTRIENLIETINK